MRARLGGSLLIAGWCAGCAAQPAAPLVNAVAPGQARITITREAPPGPAGHHRRHQRRSRRRGPGRPDRRQRCPCRRSPAGPDLYRRRAARPVQRDGDRHGGAWALRRKIRCRCRQDLCLPVAPRTDASRRAALIFGGLPGVVMEAAAKGESGGPFKITPVAP
jgi:hypothetical protein